MPTPSKHRTGYFKCYGAVVLACCIAMTGCSPLARAAEDPSVRAFHNRFFQAWNSGDLEGLVSSLTEGTVYHPMNAATIRGRDALAQVYGQFLKDYRVEMTVAAELLEADGDRGVMMGLYRSTLTPKNGDAPIVRGGRYYMELRRGADGAWRISRELTQPTADPVPSGRPAAALETTIHSE